MSPSFPTIIPPEIRAEMLEAQGVMARDTQLAITNWKHEMPSSRAILVSQVTRYLQSHINAKRSLMMEWLKENNPPVDHDWIRRTEDQIREIGETQLGYALDFYTSCDQHIPVTEEDSEDDQYDLRGRAKVWTNGWIGEFLDWARTRTLPADDGNAVRHMDILTAGRTIGVIVTSIETFDLVLDDDSGESKCSQRTIAERAIMRAKEIEELICRAQIKLRSLPKHPLIREAKEELSLLQQSLCQPAVPAEIELVSGSPENAIDVLLHLFGTALKRCGDNLRRIAVKLEVSSVDGLPDAAPNSEFNAPISPAVVEDDEIVAKLRGAIQSRPDGASTKADIIISIAHVGQKKGRMALRKLEALGEYTGFARSTPARFRR